MSVSKLFLHMFRVLLLGAIAAGEANAQVQVYAAKFTCGQVPPDPGGSGDADVVVGVYTTSINIHNPQRFWQVFTKKVVVAVREEGSFQPIKPTDTGTETVLLEPDAAHQVDCPVIYRVLKRKPEPGSHIEGFVVLYQESPISNRPLSLDVVGKYSARPSNGEVSSLDVVVYTPTQIIQPTFP